MDTEQRQHHLSRGHGAALKFGGELGRLVSEMITLGRVRLPRPGHKPQTRRKQIPKLKPGFLSIPTQGC